MRLFVLTKVWNENEDKFVDRMFKIFDLVQKEYIFETKLTDE